MVSSACASVTLINFTVSGAPVMRSAPTIFVPPTLPHSVRIVRTGTAVASTETRPSWKSSFRLCAAAGQAVANRECNGEK